MLNSPLEDMLVVELALEAQEEAEEVCMESYDIILGLDSLE